MRWEWSEERDKDKGWDRESEIWSESWDELPLWLWATVWTPLSCTVSPRQEHLLRIISFPTTEYYAIAPSGCATQLKPTWRRGGMVYTLIISCVTYRKIESVEYSGAEHRKPGYETQQLSSISAATEPTWSSYYVQQITMRWCDLTWQPVCWLSQLDMHS